MAPFSPVPVPAKVVPHPAVAHNAKAWAAYAASRKAVYAASDAKGAAS